MIQIFSAGRTGRDGTGRDPSEVVQEVLADLKSSISEGGKGRVTRGETGTDNRR